MFTSKTRAVNHETICVLLKAIFRPYCSIYSIFRSLEEKLTELAFLVCEEFLCCFYLLKRSKKSNIFGPTGQLIYLCVCRVCQSGETTLMQTVPWLRTIQRPLQSKFFGSGITTKKFKFKAERKEKQKQKQNQLQCLS